MFRIRHGSKDKPQRDWANGGAIADPAEAFDTFIEARTNIGVRTDRLVVVDVDAHREGLETLKGHPPLPATYTVRTPNGGLHLYLRAPAGADLSGGTDKLGQGVDIKTGPKSYVMGVGSTFKGREYLLERDAPVAECPAWLLERLVAAHRKSAEAPKTLGELDTPASIEAATAYLKDAAPAAVEGSGGNEMTFKVACQVKDRGVSEPVCFDLMWEHYNLRCLPEWPADELETVVANAYRYGQVPAGRDNPAAGFCAVELPKPENSRSLSYWVGDEPLDAEIDWLVDETIQRGGIGFLGGKSGAGKTFQLVHLALSGAMQRPFYGRKIEAGFGTYIVAAEGSYSITHRVKAAAVHAFGLDSRAARQLPLKFTKGAIDVMSSAGLEAFIADLRQVDADMRREFGVPLGLVVFDTFGQAFTLRDEDASTEVTRATKIMHSVSQTIGATCLATHHFGHGPERLRGSSALRANADFVIELRKNGEVFLEKCRDAAECRLGWAELPIVQVGTKKDGQPITSCFVRELARPNGTAAAPEDGFTSVQSGRDFEDALAKVPSGEAAAVEAAFKAARSGKPDSRRKAWDRALKKALATAYVLEGGRLYKRGPDIPDMSGF
ncbi:hypothetical protein W911_00270 [Hyphomicrobium nitrativorans NL23]|uniref:DNA primase/polymerase bifunctional N-terminal domain-containing protein n=1 Tax=Hyphomicrobium nitrativorans NL23 TaxID=1029756 RepID=V5SGY8_9HYPH|nr:hypothetical protein W911_00270 [Hyphomicrobium nitrativorans NL23]